jgi:two-component system, OmpR family, sensor kinase
MHVFIDTTGVLRLEEEKRNLKYQRIMFVSVSHEFRTPLNVIINSFEFIEDQFSYILSFLKNSQNKELRKIERNVERIKKFVEIGINSSTLLMNLIEDILDLSKIEAGTFVINPSDF